MCRSLTKADVGMCVKWNYPQNHIGLGTIKLDELMLMVRKTHEIFYPLLFFSLSKLEDSAITFLKDLAIPIEDWTRHFTEMKKIPNSPITKHQIIDDMLEAVKSGQSMKTQFKNHSSGSCGLFNNSFCDKEEISFIIPDGKWAKKFDG